MARTLLVALLLVAPLLTGCLGLGGGDDGAPENATRTSATGDPGEAVPSAVRTPRPADEDLAPVRFTDEPLEAAVTWANGTFTLAEHSWPKGIVTSIVDEYDPDRREIDLTGQVPAGIATLVEIEVNAELSEGDVDVWIEFPPEAIWAFEGHAPFGGHTYQAYTVVLGPGEPVTAVLRYDEVDPSTEFDYTLRIAITPFVDVLPPGVPVAFAMEPGDGLYVIPDGADADDEFLLWDEFEDFLGRIVLNQRKVVSVEESGEVVLLLEETAAPARLGFLARDVDHGGPAPTPRALAQEILSTEVVSGPADEELVLTFETLEPMLQTGIGWWGSTVATATEATLSGPTGPVLDASFESGELPWMGPGFFVLTDLGTKELPAGPYEARVHFEGAGPDDVNLQAYQVYFVR